MDDSDIKEPGLAELAGLMEADDAQTSAKGHHTDPADIARRPWCQYSNRTIH